MGRTKKIGLTLLVCFLTFMSQASQKAVTDEGDIVILNDDGTWVFERPNTASSNEIPINEQEFEKSPNSSFRVKSTKNNTGIWLDTKKWSFDKGSTNEDSEFEFKLKGEDLYGMLITEQIELDMEALTQTALENAQFAAPNMKIAKREYRIVNGVRAIYMEMQGTMQGAEFTFLGYYFTNNTGSTQFLTYTGTNLTGKYDAEIREFLNGFSIQ